MEYGQLFFNLICVPLGIAGAVFWWRMLVDCFAKQRGVGRFFWFAVIMAPNFAGLMVYYFVKWRPRRRAELGLA